MKGLKPSERQKVNEINKKVDKASDEDLMEEKSATPTHDEVIETGLKDPDVDEDTKEHLRRVKAAKQKKKDEGELTYKDVREAAKDERDVTFDKVIKNMERKGEIDSAKERRKKAKRNNA